MGGSLRTRAENERNIAGLEIIWLFSESPILAFGPIALLIPHGSIRLNPVGSAR